MTQMRTTGGFRSDEASSAAWEAQEGGSWGCEGTVFKSHQARMD